MWDDQTPIREVVEEIDENTTRYTYLAMTVDGSWICLAPFDNRLPSEVEFMQWAQQQATTIRFPEGVLETLVNTPMEAVQQVYVAGRRFVLAGDEEVAGPSPGPDGRGFAIEVTLPEPTGRRVVDVG